MKIKLLLLFAAAILAGLVFSGCGYRIGSSLMHPQIKTIGIPPPVNDTNVYNLSALLRGQLSEQFMVDGSLKVVDPEKADCLIYCRVVSVGFAQTTIRSYDELNQIFVPNEWTATVTIEFSVVLPGRKEPLVKTRTVSGNAAFQSPSDMETTRSRGISQASRQAAISIIEFTTEAW
jgi:hypothetical protein